MDALEQFWLGLPASARIGGQWSVAFVLVFGLMRWRFADLPANAPARGRWVACLRHDGFSRRYREALAAGLDWLDARLSPGFPADPSAPKTEIARAWSAPLLNLCLLLALLYPGLSLVIDWAATGDVGRLGRLDVIPAEDALWFRVAVVGGLCGLAGLAYAARRARMTSLRLLVAVSAGAILFFVIFTDVLQGVDLAPPTNLLILGSASALTLAFTGAGVVASGLAASGAMAVVVGGSVGLGLASPVTCLFAFVVDPLGKRYRRPLLIVSFYAVLLFGLLAAATLSVMQFADDGRAALVFLGFLPLLNAAADFASTGLTRWWLRQGLRGNLVGHALRDAGAALGILAALGFALIATIRWVRPQDGTPLLDLPALFADLRANPGAYYWLYVCFFSTLLPTVLHLAAACFGLFTLASKRLGQPIAELLQAGASDSVKAKDGVVALSLCVTLALLAPFAAFHALFAVAGRPLLFALLSLFEWWARLIGAM